MACPNPGPRGILDPATDFKWPTVFLALKWHFVAPLLKSLQFSMTVTAEIGRKFIQI